MTWKNYIENMKKKWVGKNVTFNNGRYKIIDVDYNGSLMINLPSKYNHTTAIAEWMIGKTLPQVQAEYEKH